MFIASTNLFVLLFGFGIGHAITYYMAKNELEEGNILTSLIIQAIVISLLLFSIVHVAHRFGYTNFFLPENKSNLFFEVLLAGCVFAGLLYRNIISILNGKKDFNAINTVNLTITVLPLLIYGVYFLCQTYGLFTPSVKNIFLTHLGLMVSNLGLILYVYLKRGGSTPSKQLISFKLVKKLMLFASLIYIGSIAQFLNYKIDYWFINYFTGSKELGIYSLSAGLVQIVWLLPQSMSTVIFPNIAQDQKNQKERIVQLSKFSFFIMILGAIFSYFFAADILPLLYGAEFIESARIFNILLIGAVPFCVGIILSGYFLGVGMPNITFRASFIGLFMTIVLDILLIKDYGIEGAAVASSISYLVSSIYLIIRFYNLKDNSE